VLIAISGADDARAGSGSYRLLVARFRRDHVPLALVGDVLLAAVFTLAAELDVWVRHTVSGPRLTNAVLLAFVAPPLVIRRRWPCTAVLVTAAAIALQAIVVGKPPSGFLYWPILILSYSLGAHAPASKRALATLAALAAAYSVFIVYSTSTGGVNVTAVPWMLASLVPWLLGHYVRGRRERAAALVADERREREGEQRRLKALEQERARMARELHDILAHSVSLMGVQAGAAEQVLAREPERARPVLRSIQQSSRDSVAELRRLLGMLRAPELEPELAPQPGLDQLGLLVARMREAGLPVQLVIEGDAQPLSAGLELTAYRVIQEGLTNALKHARPSHVEVVIRHENGYLGVSVTNDGVAIVGNGNGSGHGLIGMNERVSLYGGTLRAGPQPGGGFSIKAELPLEAGSP
jgi:signal transduction histidine kinase